MTDLIAFLSDPGSYPESTTQVTIIQTHVSVLALCDNYVYKVKKPVNFEFLDFSTVEKRKFFCEEELRLNARLTHDIYLGVVEIFNGEGGLSFKPGEEIVDYAVKMKRMAQQGFLDYLVENDLDNNSHYNTIIDHLANFYTNLPSQQLNPEYGSPDSIAYIIRENRILREKFIDRTLTSSQEQVIAQYQAYFLQHFQGLLVERMKEGWIKDVHGDLRLEHFHFEDGKLNIYDCIEFMERLRVNDIVNDIAFLCMELDFCGRHDQSEAIYTELCQRQGDSPCDELLRFYKLHRACVRGMVHAVAGHEVEVTPKDQLRNRDKSKKLFAMATRYAVLPVRPTVIVVYGGVATGKSTVASRLAECLHLPVIQGDALRKELAGLPLDERPEESVRESLYSPDMTERVYHTMAEQAAELLVSHNAVILDSRFAAKVHRSLLKSRLDSPVIWIRTTASDTLRRERLRERERVKSISDARLDNWDVLLSTETGLQDELTDLEVGTAEPIESCLEQILESLVRIRTQYDNSD